MKKVIALAAFFPLAACIDPNPTVADYNGDSVKIQTHQMADATKAAAVAQAEANRICSKGSKKRAEYASTRQLPNYVSEHLYLCL